MIKIISFENKYLEEMGKLFSLVYSDSEGIYPLELAKKRLEDDLKTGFDYSFVAVDENKVVGGIICKKTGEKVDGSFMWTRLRPIQNFEMQG